MDVQVMAEKIEKNQRFQRSPVTVQESGWISMEIQKVRTEHKM